jgi:hypothetical protein
VSVVAAVVVSVVAALVVSVAAAVVVSVVASVVVLVAVAVVVLVAAVVTLFWRKLLPFAACLPACVCEQQFIEKFVCICMVPHLKILIF